jgi:hypothetical protein
VPSSEGGEVDVNGKVRKERESSESSPTGKKIRLEDEAGVDTTTFAAQEPGGDVAM